MTEQTHLPLPVIDQQVRSPHLAATRFDVFTVDDPATGQPLMSVPDIPVSQVSHFLSTAEKAQDQWETQTPRHRANVLLRAYELLLEKCDDFATTMTLEMGKPFRESLGEVQFAADYLRWFSEQAVRSQGSFRQAPNGDARLFLHHRPVGPTFLITPWNFPLAMGARKVAPALAAGCTAILKPASETPLTSLLFADLMYEAGVPRDVFQVVTTSDARGWSADIMSDRRLKKVSFTGSTQVGSTIIRQSAQHVQKLSLELGGDAPFIVFDDADLERAVEAAITAKIRNGGQACVAANRFLVQDGIADEFSQVLTQRLGSLVVGHGLDPDTDLGPLITSKALASTEQLVRDAVDKGAQVSLAGGRTDQPGHFYRPTVLQDVPASADMSCNEIFAPVAAIDRFSSISESVQKANDTPFALAAYVFSQDIDTAMSVSASMNAGVVGINKGLVADATSEFGGNAYSGYGREGGIQGMEDFQTLHQFNLDAPRARWIHD